MLSLFAREALERSDPIASLLVERVVMDDLADPESNAVASLRRSIRDRFGERVSAAMVVSTLERLLNGAPLAPAELGEATAEALEPGTPTQRRTRRSPNAGSRVTIAQLVEAGLLPTDAVLEARVAGVSHVARIRDGRIDLNGTLYDSPSAASMALRGAQSWNGWVDWAYRGVKLAELRRQLATSEESRPIGSGGA